MSSPVAPAEAPTLAKVPTPPESVLAEAALSPPAEALFERGEAPPRPTLTNPVRLPAPTVLGVSAPTQGAKVATACAQHRAVTLHAP